MPDPLPSERISEICVLFFGRLEATHRDLVQAVADLLPPITSRNHNITLALLADLEIRIQAMRSILIVFRECLEG